MARRRLTAAEVRAYRRLASAARQLEKAEKKAEAQCRQADGREVARTEGAADE